MTRSILFVCSDEDARDTYGAALRQAGIMPVTVPSVPHALSFYGQAIVAVTVVHVDPDVADAWDECERLLTQPTPVVVLTARHRADPRRRILPGCAAFLSTPCPPNVLVEIVKRVSAGERGLTWPTAEAVQAAV